MLTAVASWYANGIRADTQSPSTAYVTIHTHDRAAMSAEDNTSPALRARSSSESEGSAPISTNRCSGFGSRSTEANSEEKAELWPRLVEMYGDYEIYQRRTEREIPVVILSPAA